MNGFTCMNPHIRPGQLHNPHTDPAIFASSEDAHKHRCCAAGVGDAGLQELSALTSLTSLNLDSRLFTDLGMRHLKGLTNLVVLDLFAAKVSDIGCGYLRWAPQCLPHSSPCFRV